MSFEDMPHIYIPQVKCKNIYMHKIYVHYI